MDLRGIGRAALLIAAAVWVVGGAFADGSAGMGDAFAKKTYNY